MIKSVPRLWQAAVAIAMCIDVDDPSPRAAHNYWVFDKLCANKWFAGQLQVKWISDLNKQPTEAEIQQNRQTLRRVSLWLLEQQAKENEGKAF